MTLNNVNADNKLKLWDMCSFIAQQNIEDDIFFAQKENILTFFNWWTQHERWSVQLSEW